MSQASDSDIRPGEVTATLPTQTHAGVYFIGIVHTPWESRRDCPKRGDTTKGPVCTIVIDERWRVALTGIAAPRRLQVLYWMHEARRDLVIQAPGGNRLAGTFALRSPVRPNPIASSMIELVAIRDNILEVRGLDCIDGTPLIDLKPDRTSDEPSGQSIRTG